MSDILTPQMITAEISRLENKIKTKNEEIARLRGELKTLNDSLRFYKSRQNDILWYERKIEPKKVLYSYIAEYTKTVPLMDQFEKRNPDGQRKYDFLILENFSFSFPLIIERYDQRRPIIGDITMTNFKKGNSASELKKYIHEAFSEYNSTHGKRTAPYEVVWFKEVYKLRAQNSHNRTGYGNEYCGEHLVYEGTLYGETTDYAIVGIFLCDAFQTESVLNSLKQNNP